MKIVVDTNIVFSALLNTESSIAKILLHHNKNVEFYSSGFLKTEIRNHWQKLLKLTNLSEESLIELEELVTQRITFIDERLIPKKTFLDAQKLLKDIDENDSIFVALNDLLKGHLWTGDKQLYTGLKSKNYNRILFTQEVTKLIDELEEE